jgi:L,D-transpeptidase catalytic domain
MLRLRTRMTFSRPRLPSTGHPFRFPAFLRVLTLIWLTFMLGACAKDRIHTVRVSVPEQRMAVYAKGLEIARYTISTSRFGLGNEPGSNRTPLGKFEIAQKIGAGAPLGMKFKSREPTGEIVPVDAPGRDRSSRASCGCAVWSPPMRTLSSG